MGRAQREVDAHLDVGVEPQQCPLAVAGVDAQRQLHLLVEHHKNPNTLLLQPQRLDSDSEG